MFAIIKNYKRNFLGLIRSEFAFTEGGALAESDFKNEGNEELGDLKALKKALKDGLTSQEAEIIIKEANDITGEAEEGLREIANNMLENGFTVKDKKSYESFKELLKKGGIILPEYEKNVILIDTLGIKSNITMMIQSNKIISHYTIDNNDYFFTRDYKDGQFIGSYKRINKKDAVAGDKINKVDGDILDDNISGIEKKGLKKVLALYLENGGEKPDIDKLDVSTIAELGKKFLDSLKIINDKSEINISNNNLKTILSKLNRLKSIFVDKSIDSPILDKIISKVNVKIEKIKKQELIKQQREANEAEDRKDLRFNNGNYSPEGISIIKEMMIKKGGETTLSVNAREFVSYDLKTIREKFTRDGQIGVNTLKDLGILEKKGDKEYVIVKEGFSKEMLKGDYFKKFKISDYKTEILQKEEKKQETINIGQINNLHKGNEIPLDGKYGSFIGKDGKSHDIIVTSDSKKINITLEGTGVINQFDLNFKIPKEAKDTFIKEKIQLTIDEYFEGNNDYGLKTKLHLNDKQVEDLDVVGIDYEKVVQKGDKKYYQLDRSGLWSNDFLVSIDNNAKSFNIIDTDGKLGEGINVSKTEELKDTLIKADKLLNLISKVETRLTPDDNEYTKDETELKYGNISVTLENGKVVINENNKEISLIDLDKSISALEKVMLSDSEKEEKKAYEKLGLTDSISKLNELGITYEGLEEKDGNKYYRFDRKGAGSNDFLIRENLEIKDKFIIKDVEGKVDIQVTKDKLLSTIIEIDKKLDIFSKDQLDGIKEIGIKKSDMDSFLNETKSKFRVIDKDKNEFEIDRPGEDDIKITVNADGTLNVKNDGLLGENGFIDIKNINKSKLTKENLLNIEKLLQINKLTKSTEKLSKDDSDNVKILEDFKKLDKKIDNLKDLSIDKIKKVVLNEKTRENDLKDLIDEVLKDRTILKGSTGKIEGGKYDGKTFDMEFSLEGNELKMDTKWDQPGTDKFMEIDLSNIKDDTSMKAAIISAKNAMLDDYKKYVQSIPKVKLDEYGRPIN